jgi:hypothetical protein
MLIEINNLNHRKEIHQGWIVRDASEIGDPPLYKLALDEVVIKEYPHPEAPDQANIPVMETVTRVVKTIGQEGYHEILLMYYHQKVMDNLRKREKTINQSPAEYNGYKIGEYVRDKQSNTCRKIWDWSIRPFENVIDGVWLGCEWCYVRKSFEDIAKWEKRT